MTRVEQAEEGFGVETDAGERYHTQYVIAATKNTTDYRAEQPHQAVVRAGHSTEIAVTILKDDDRPFDHDWVRPDGYVTDHGRDLPPGCEEISEEERRQREEQSLEPMRSHVAEPRPDGQATHPSLRDE